MSDKIVDFILRTAQLEDREKDRIAIQWLLQVLYGFFVADYKPRLILYLAFSQTAVFMYLFGSFFRYSSKSHRQSMFA